MAEAWAICPVCGKALALEPVLYPGEPVALAQHLREHRQGSPSGDARAAGRGESASNDGEAKSKLPDHPVSRPSSNRPHGRPRAEPPRPAPAS